MAQAIDEALLDEFAALSGPSGKPTTAEEVEAAKAAKEARNAWLTAKAAERGYENVGTLEKELAKALNKRFKKATPAGAGGKAAPGAESKGAAGERKAGGAAGGGAAASASAPAAPAAGGEGDEPEKDLDAQMRRVLGHPKDNTGRGGFFVNPPEILAAHLAATGGVYQTRFPPEPNGWLHIGHAKSMSVNFGIAAANGGNCYLRFDDTNPEAEKQEYIDGIIENVAWLGHKPFKTTYTSDYSQQMFDLACELIRRGKAYVCRLSGAQVKAQRDAIIAYNKAVAETKEGEVPPPFPDAAVYDKDRELNTPEQNLALFFRMKQGRFEEGEATLRMKGDFHSKNPNMWDHMAYRILYKRHPHTGDAWCIYPTYDFSHCLIDSFENITHSICTLEFETRQANDSSYHWLLDSLGMYHAKTWEMSRCSISHSVMSKRRLQRLVREKYVRGWDDPRLLTLAGLRRRGYTPTSINDFCRRTGVARSSNEVCISVSALEACVRSELDQAAERRLAVLDPVRVVINNFDKDGAPRAVTVPNHPAKGREEMGTREVPLTPVVFIPREKFRTEMVPGYKGLVPGQPKNAQIRLLYAAVVEYESHSADAEGNVTEIRVKYVPGDPAKGINVVAWVPSNASRVEARLYDRLFKNCIVDGVEVHAERAAKDLGVDFVELFNEDSLHVKNMLVEPCVMDELTVERRWQFITVGYFCIDRIDSTKDKPVLNMIVSLKEDKDK